MILKRQKHPFLLLEVIIAFTLIALCMIPLIYPHSFILTKQKRFVQKTELDHFVHLVFADIVKTMYTNELPWNRIVSDEVFQIDEQSLNGLPYKGIYWFEEKIHKPEDDSKKKAYLIYLFFEFVPLESQKKHPKPLKYGYLLFVVRDLSAFEGDAA